MGTGSRRSPITNATKRCARQFSRRSAVERTMAGAQSAAAWQMAQAAELLRWRFAPVPLTTGPLSRERLAALEHG